MSVFDKNYKIKDMSVISDTVSMYTDTWTFGDDYYVYSLSPSWFETIEVTTGRFLPFFTIRPPQNTNAAVIITVEQRDWATGTLVDTITIKINVIGNDTPWNIKHCRTTSLVWYNPYGVWESYVYESNQQTFQTEGKTNTVINDELETLISSKDDVYQGVIVSTSNIPRAHIEHIANQFKSIQAYLWDGGFTSILIKPQSIKKIKTGEPFARYEFEFTYNKQDIIASQ